VGGVAAALSTNPTVHSIFAKNYDFTPVRLAPPVVHSYSKKMLESGDNHIKK
jgi:hypothetical protein